MTLVYEFAIGRILEFIKIVMQTSPPGTTYAQVVKDITAEKGIGGLWDGFCPWGVVQSLFKGSVFGLAHSVEVTAESQLATLLGTTEVAVNSFHHQSVMQVGEGLQVTAVAPDGIIEGMEMPEQNFVVSVQWHPENITGVVDEMKGLFRGLVEAA